MWHEIVFLQLTCKLYNKGILCFKRWTSVCSITFKTKTVEHIYYGSVSLNKCSFYEDVCYMYMDVGFYAYNSHFYQKYRKLNFGALIYKVKWGKRVGYGRGVGIQRVTERYFLLLLKINLNIILN